MATSGENADENLAGARDGLPRACSGRLGPGAARVIAPEGRFEGVTLGSGLAPRRLPAGLPHDEVDQLAGHVDLLHDLLALEEAHGVGGRPRPSQHAVLLRVDRHLEAVAQLAVD